MRLLSWLVAGMLLVWSAVSHAGTSTSALSPGGADPLYQTERAGADIPALSTAGHCVYYSDALADVLYMSCDGGAYVAVGSILTTLTLIEQATPAVSAAGECDVYADSVTHTIYESCNGGPWYIIWSAGNDGAGSGLDADLLDALHAAAFCQIAGGAACTMTGTTIWNTGAGTDAEMSEDGLDRSSAGAEVFNVQNSGAGSMTLQCSGNTVWHAGNDGTGSGLDADTVDAVHAAAICQVAGGAACTMLGQTIYSGVATDITTGTDEDLTVSPNGTGVLSVTTPTTMAGGLTFDGPATDITTAGVEDLTLSPGGAVSVTTPLVIGDNLADTVTSNAGVWSFPNSTTVSLAASSNAFNIDGNTLSVDALNNVIVLGASAILTGDVGLSIQKTLVGGANSRYGLTNSVTTSGADATYGPIGLRSLLAAGHTGAASSYAGYFDSRVAGVASAWYSDANGYRPGGNGGLVTRVKSTTTGNNIGNTMTAADGDMNIGGLGSATVAKAGAVNCGGMFFGRNTGGGGATQFGAFVSLGGGTATAPTTGTSAALAVTNDDQTSDILSLRDNTTAVMTVANGGFVGIGIAVPTTALEVVGDITLSGDLLPKTDATLVYTPTRFTETDTTNVNATGASAIITPSDGIPLFVWGLANVADTNVTVGKCDAVACANLTLTTVGTGPGNCNQGVSTAMYLASDGMPVIVWHTGCGSTGTSAINFRKCSNVSCTAFDAAAVTTGDVDALGGIAVALNAAGTTLGVSYVKQVGGVYRGYYFRCDDPNAASPCATRQAENCVGLTLASACTGTASLYGTGIGMDGTDKPTVFYIGTGDDRIYNNLCGDDQCSGGGGYTVTDLTGAIAMTPRYVSVDKGADNFWTVGASGAHSTGFVGRCGDLACTSVTPTVITLTHMTAGLRLNPVTGLPVLGTTQFDATATASQFYVCSGATCVAGTGYDITTPSGNLVGNPSGIVISPTGLAYFLYGSSAGDYDAYVAMLDLTAAVPTGTDLGAGATQIANVYALGDYTGRDLVLSRNLYLGDQGEARFYDADGSNYTYLRGGAVIAANHGFDLPVADGAAGEAMVTDGAGALAFAAIPGPVAFCEIFEVTGYTLNDIGDYAADTGTEVTFETDGEESGCDADQASNKLEVTTAYAGKYLINVSFAFGAGATTVNTVYRAGVHVDGTLATNCQFARKIGASADVGSASVTCILDLASVDTDAVTLRVWGELDADDVTIDKTTMNLHKLD